MSGTMACPTCGEMRCRTIDSRANSIGVRRRKVCNNNHRFTTYEITEVRMKAIKTAINTLEELLQS